MKNPTIKQLTKSKTLIFAVLIAMLPQVLALLPRLEGFLGDYYQIVFVAISLIIGYLRTITKKPLGEK